MKKPKMVKNVFTGSVSCRSLDYREVLSLPKPGDTKLFEDEREYVKFAASLKRLEARGLVSLSEYDSEAEAKKAKASKDAMARTRDKMEAKKEDPKDEPAKESAPEAAAAVEKPKEKPKAVPKIKRRR